MVQWYNSGGMEVDVCFPALQVGNTWRTTQDISLAVQATWPTVMDNLDGTKGLARFAGPGGWNDPDMLEVGGCFKC